MAYESLFATLGGNQNGEPAYDIPALFTVNRDNPEKIVDWTREALHQLSAGQADRAQTAWKNRDFYANIQNPAIDRVGIPRDREWLESYKKARLTASQVFDLTEQWVSKLTRFPPAYNLIPPNTERNDRINAKLSKQFLDYNFYVNDIDSLCEKFVRNARIDGQSFIYVTYNKNKGDVDPAFAEAENLGLQKIPLVDPTTGEPILSEEGEPLTIEKRQRVGDLDYKVLPASQVYVDPKAEWEDVEWMIWVHGSNVDCEKAEHPEFARQIDKKTAIVPTWQKSDISVVEIFQRGNHFLDDGLYIKIIGDVVVEMTTLKEKVGHTELPFVRLTCIDVPGELHGMSFLQNLLILQVVYNNLLSIAYNNLARGAHMYWLLPQSAGVDATKLRNAPSIIKYAGSVAPRIETFKTVGMEIFQLLAFLEKQIAKISGIQPLSQGTPPAGIESQVALVFLEEQEDQRANSDIKKYNSALKKLARLTLATAGFFYDPSDGRTIRIVGKNNQFSVKALSAAKLGGPYDIRVQRSTALSESKSGRLSQLLAIEARKPGVIPDKQFLDMLELANDEKFYDLATVAVQKAEHENEQMFEGSPVKEPVEFEEHMTHWITHFKYIQSASFGEDVSPEIQQLFFDHILVHEYFMLKKIQVNPRFAQMMLAMPEMENFPAFLNQAPQPPATPPMAPGMAPPMMGEAPPGVNAPPPLEEPGGVEEGAETMSAENVPNEEI